MRGSLARRLLLLQLAVVSVTAIIGAAVSVTVTRERTRDAERSRALSVARTVAQTPEVADELVSAPGRLQARAERIRRATGVAYVVVMTPDGIRRSHPRPEEVGRRYIGAIGAAQRGGVVTEQRRGTLGDSVRAVVPVRDASGRIVGLVAVGVLAETIGDAFQAQVPRLLALALVALAVGTALSLLLARRVKRQTLGLEPTQIAAMYSHHDATLHAIREGVVVWDADGRVTLMNDEARRLLGDDAAALKLGEEARDATVLVGDRVLVVNVEPTTTGGRVATLRDRTELEGLGRELETVRGMADSLRAQAHEAANHLHTIVGLVEIGHAEEAIAFATERAGRAQDLLARLQDRIDEPSVVALLLGKTAVAAERGIELEVSDDSCLEPHGLPTRELVTIVGNLVDNALDAARSHVEVLLVEDGDGVRIEVRDDGPGIPAGLDVFERGVSTKASSGRGLGLGLVRQATARLGGTVSAHNDGGAVFVATFPLRVRT